MKGQRGHLAIVFIFDLTCSWQFETFLRLLLHPDVHFTVATGALSHLHPARALHELEVLAVLIERGEILLHVHTPIISLQVAIFDSQDVQFCLRLSLLLTKSFFNVGDHLHGLAHL